MIGWYFLVGILVTLCAGLLAVGMRISGLLRFSLRQPLSRSPAVVGLAYEDVTFPSADGLLLKGWWLPAYQDSQQTAQCPAVVLLHPMFGNRHGFSREYQGRPHLIKAEVDLLQVAVAFHQAGFSVLMFDFRGHGESQAGICAGGLAEDQDVSSAVAYVFQRLAPKDPLLRPSQ